MKYNFILNSLFRITYTFVSLETLRELTAWGNPKIFGPHIFPMDPKEFKSAGMSHPTSLSLQSITLWLSLVREVVNMNPQATTRFGE